ncbi:hypothetical protein M8C21_007213, partial [Ambrosia artemisiifolia]
LCNVSPASIVSHPQFTIARTNSKVKKIKNYFGCFFALPIVFSSMRWDIVAGRKTMVATATLLLVLAGPIKAITYLLMHGFLGLAMGSLWRSKASWGVSVLVSALVRAAGAMCYVVMYSFLIRENILALITINIHASVTFILSSFGFLVIPSMNIIYAIFGTVFLCVPATSSICPLLYKAWNEGFPEITELYLGEELKKQNQIIESTANSLMMLYDSILMSLSERRDLFFGFFAAAL